MKKKFKDLTEKEILALAISLEEEDAKIYADFASSLKEIYPHTAELFIKMSEVENNHRQRLLTLYKQLYGDIVPVIRPQDVKGFIERKPPWFIKTKGVTEMRRYAALLELETRLFYEKALTKTENADLRKLLGDLAQEELKHEHEFEHLSKEIIDKEAEIEESETAHRLFLLQVIQPGLAGLMDGSVSTLAPLFAAAFATQNSHDAFIVGVAASVGAGISMGFAEALSDDGSLTGRGKPWLRGTICGVMTVLGGIFHTLPYLISDFLTATTLAVLIVIAELLTIAYIRYKYMSTPVSSAIVQVIIGGLLVFLTGVFLGNA